MKKLIALLAFSSLFTLGVSAADYQVDIKGAHASINFKVKHLGYSWLTGRFNQFDGAFSYDEKNPNASKVSITINTTSLDSNHAERDKHLKSDDFLNAGKYPEAKFESSKITDKGEGKLEVVGQFTMHGVTKEITIDAVKIGEGKDPWGGYRAGFSGTTKINMGDFNFKKNFGDVWLDLHIEGVRKK